MSDPVLPLYSLVTYYDASATSTDTDWGASGIGAIASEDFYFNTWTRIIALGRTRREIRNNPYLAGLVNAYPHALGTSSLRSRTGSKDYNARKNDWWRAFARNCTDKGDSLRTLENIIAREMLIAGEIFLVKLIDGRVQPITSEFCGSPAAGFDPSAELNGIVLKNGVQVSYRFGRMSNFGFIDYTANEPTPAQHVIHIFDRDRVMMGRGLPWLLPCIKTARDLYEITRSKTKQIKDANAISGWIEKQNAPSLLGGLAAPELDAAGAPKVETPDSPADPVRPKGRVVVELRPGTFVGLEPGEKLTQLMSSYNATDYKELIMLMLHAISTPVGLPVELWFSGLGDVSYSGFKGLGTQWAGRRTAVTNFLEDRGLNPLHDWKAPKAIAEDDLPAPEGEAPIKWGWKRTPVLDEEKSARANEIRISTGECSLADIWEERGDDADEVFAHRRELWIQMKIASGELKEPFDPATVIVPDIFLLRGLLPGEQPINPNQRGAIPATDPLSDPSTETAAKKKPAA